jgi:hypothetical protein
MPHSMAMVPVVVCFIDSSVLFVLFVFFYTA